MTCAGGAAAIDMMLDWIARLLGPSLSVAVADQLVHFRVTGGREQARVPARTRYGTDDLRLLAIVGAMEEQGEEPLDAASLAAVGGISIRQMERLFHTKLQARPMEIYRKLRLERAEQLLIYSHLSVRDVALACGFSSLSLFSRAFRTKYGTPPSVMRHSAGR
jgi:AraC family carnitine catabolism transcriptional activator